MHKAVVNLHKENIDKHLDIESVSKIFYSYFQYPEMPYPDALLRTAGEKRLVIFYLSTFICRTNFIDTLWPDVNEDILDDVLLEFKSRNRTYGRN